MLQMNGHMAIWADFMTASMRNILEQSNDCLHAINFFIVMVVWMTVYRYEVDDEYTIDTFEFYVSISESFFDITIQCRLSFTALDG